MAPFRYVLFHKPYDVLSQFTDRAGGSRTTLRDYVPVAGVYPVGRLDRDSEGLMLLTDDGALQHRLSDPKFEHPRTYWAQVEGILTADVLAGLEGGVVIQGYRTRPAVARLLDPDPQPPERVPPIRFRKSIPTAWIEMTLTEGRNRQVRRMTAAIGYPTLRLIRVAIGPLRLDGLGPGEWRHASRQEVSLLRTAARR